MLLCYGRCKQKYYNFKFHFGETSQIVTATFIGHSCILKMKQLVKLYEL